MHLILSLKSGVPDIEMVSGNKDDNHGVARVMIKKSSSGAHFLLFMSKILELLVMWMFFFLFNIY